MFVIISLQEVWSIFVYFDAPLESVVSELLLNRRIREEDARKQLGHHQALNGLVRVW